VCAKGKEEAIQLYEVFDGDPPELQTLKLETRANLARAQELYYDKTFSEEPAEVSASAFDEEYRTKVQYSRRAGDGKLSKTREKSGKERTAESRKR
jgi:hypothetical protein